MEIMERFPNPAILLHPNIPKPLHGVAPRTVMSSSWWYNERQSAYELCFGKCMACGELPRSSKYLHAHEFYDVDYAKCRMTYIRAIPVCLQCHDYIHSGRLYMMFTSGKYAKNYAMNVLERGFKLLKDVDLDPLGVDKLVYSYIKRGMQNVITNTDSIQRSDDNETVKCEWGDWRLVVDGIEYEPKFSTAEEWKDYYRD